MINCPSDTKFFSWVWYAWGNHDGRLYKNNEPTNDAGLPGKLP